MAAKDQDHDKKDPKQLVNPGGVDQAAAVFREYGADIRAMIEMHALNSVEADDIFQELFLSLVHTRLPEKVSSMKRYLYRAITNDLASRARANKRYLRRLKVYAETRKYKRLQDDPGKMAMRIERTREVFDRIEKLLPPREAQAVACRFQMDCDLSEAAQRMGVDRRSVTRYVCAGLKKIREIGLIRGEAPNDLSMPRKHV